MLILLLPLGLAAPPPSAPSTGMVSLEEDRFPVHTKVSVKLTYTAGEDLGPGDIIRVEEPLFHGMRWAKWGYLSTDPAGCTPLSETEAASVGYVTATTSSGATLGVTHSEGGSDIHAYGTVDVTILDGGLPAGQSLTVSLGVLDQDCGWQTANRAFTEVPIRVFELLGGGEPALVEPVPTFSFVPEDAVSTLRAILPSTAVVGEELPLRVVELDRWGNVAGDGQATLETVRFDEPGVHRVEVRRGDLTARSNPVQVTADPPERRIYWGDLHTHHGHDYTDAFTGEWIDENHAYARDVMGLDFASESVKSPSIELDWEAVWASEQRACREYTTGSYVALLGLEWMGGQDQGHHNVYVDGCELDPAGGDWVGLEEDLWPYLEGIEAELGYAVVSIPHASSYTGYNWRARDDRLRPVAEVYSEWGSSMDEGLPGSVPEGLRAGNRLGLIASSDNHDGWLGNGLAQKNAPGGLGAIVAEELTASALIAAMQERHTYATTGERILLQVEVEDGGVLYPAGSEWRGDDAVLRWTAAGTDSIDQVAVWMTSALSREDAVLWASWSPETLDAEGEVRLPWGSQTMIYWVELTQADGERAWSSPVWIQPPAKAEPRGCGSGGEAALLLLPLLLRRRRDGR